MEGFKKPAKDLFLVFPAPVATGQDQSPPALCWAVCWAGCQVGSRVWAGSGAPGSSPLSLLPAAVAG